MSKFFIDKEQLDIENNRITILGEDVNHIKNVLRFACGDKIQVSIKQEIPESYEVQIEKIEKDQIVCGITQKIEETNEPPIFLSIYQGLPKSDKMELIIQKCTEIGACEFTPLELKNCVVKLAGKDIQKKQDRWQKIAEVAAKQCGRDIIPKVNMKINLKEFCNLVEKYDIVLVAYEQETNITLKSVLNTCKEIKKIAVVIGPEGGFDKNEIHDLKEKGAKIISLGRRILRTETAPIVLSSIIMYEKGMN